jgi:carotenoid 1,2-hydratase
VDALSDDGRYGITLIAFVGSVFSPYYAWARRRGRPDPYHHCALNVALYGVGGPSWSCTERGRTRLNRSATHLAIGESTISWSPSGLEICVDETTAPVPRRIRGVVRLHPTSISSSVFELDHHGAHRWAPISPCARVEVILDSPGLRWGGHGYLDTNEGDEPLENAFSHWHWSRATLADGSAVLYDVLRRDGQDASVALRFRSDGSVSEQELPPRAALPTSLWRIERGTRSDPGAPPSVRRTLEDGPFYARSVLSTQLFGERTAAIHESLSLDRFRAGWVQAMLPFRMPRAYG